MKRIILAIVLSYLASTAAQSQPPNWPEPVNATAYSRPDVKPTAYNGRIVGARPKGCPVLWCGCWLSRYLGLNDRKLWLARAWARIGRPAKGPAPGVIAVYRRGKRGGHVGIVKRVVDHDTIVLLSGNDGGAVRQRERSTKGVIAYRIVNPHAAQVAGAR